MTVPTPIPLTEFAVALELGGRTMVALVGGGGKTTLLQALSRQLPGRVVATTTTKMGASQHAALTVLLNPSDDELAAALNHSPVIVWRRTEGSKAIGFDPEQCASWTALADHVVVEADGARRRPFKAPGPFEPLVPSTTTDLVSVIGVDAIGRAILDQCHRPLRVAALADCQPGERLTPSRAAAVLLHERGMRRALPPGARLHIVVTKIDETTEAAARQLAEAVISTEPMMNVVLIRNAQGA